jgi:hypothetical protein
VLKQIIALYCENQMENINIVWNFLILKKAVHVITAVF